MNQDQNNSSNEFINATPLYETVLEEENTIVKGATEAPESPSVQVPESVSPPVQPEPISDYENQENHEISNRKYILIGIIAVIIIVVVVFVLKSAIFSPPKEITLTYWGLWEEKQLIDPLINSYKQKHPEVTIQYIQQSPKNYRKKILTQIKDGAGPDIFRFHNTWLPTIKDVAAPLPESILSNTEFEKTFYKVVQSDLKIDKNYYGIPLEIDCLVLLYNSDMFMRAGIENAPETWDDIINYSQQLAVPDSSGNLVTGGIALGTAENIDHYSDILGWMFLQNGVTLKSLRTKAAADVIQVYRHFSEEPNKVWDETLPNSIQSFAQGKVGMIIIPSWQILTVKSINPNLKFKVTELPLLPSEKQPFSIATYWVEGVSRAGKHQKEAWEFLKFISGKDEMIQLFSLQSSVRLFGEPYSRVDLREIMLQNELLRPVAAQAPYLQSIPTNDKTFDDGLNDGISGYLKAAINNTIKSVSYSSALDSAADGIDQILKQYAI